MESLATRWKHLEWRIRRSIRYHARREAFFARLESSSLALNALLGSATLASFSQVVAFPPFFGLPLGAAFGAAVAVVSAVDLAIGFGARARRYAELRRRFYDAEVMLLGEQDEERYAAAMAHVLRTEGDEPPMMYALDVLCHNELMVASGKKMSNCEDARDFYEVNWIQRLTSQVISWSNSKFPPLRS